MIKLNKSKWYIINFIIITLFTLSCKNETETCLYRIPFSIINNKIIIKALVNDSDTLNFIFDTGCDFADINIETARKLNIIPFATIHGYCVGSENILQIALCNFRINNLLLQTDTTTLSPSVEYYKKLKIKINGHLGKNIFKRYITKIDFENEVIELYPLKTKIDSVGYSVFLLNKDMTIFANTVLQNNLNIRGKYLFDSGSYHEISLNHIFADSIVLKSLIGNYKISYSKDLCENKLKETVGKIKKFEIGKFSINSLIVAVADSNYGVFSSGNLCGIIGLPVIKKFDVIIDYPNSKIYLKLNAFSKN